MNVCTYLKAGECLKVETLCGTAHLDCNNGLACTWNAYYYLRGEEGTPPRSRLCVGMISFIS